MSAKHSQSAPKDTPTTNRTVSHTHTGGERTKARARDVAAKKELKSMITAAQSEDLFLVVLPVQKTIINDILAELKGHGFYRDGTWKGLLKSKKGINVEEDTYRERNHSNYS